MQGTYLAMERMSKQNGGQVISPSILNFLFLYHDHLSDHHHISDRHHISDHHHLSDHDHLSDRNHLSDHQGGLIINTASAAGIIFGDQDPALVDFCCLFFFSKKRGF